MATPVVEHAEVDISAGMEAASPAECTWEVAWCTAWNRQHCSGHVAWDLVLMSDGAFIAQVAKEGRWVPPMPPTTHVLEPGRDYWSRKWSVVIRVNKDDMAFVSDASEWEAFRE